MAYDKEEIKKELLANIQMDEHITTFEDASATVDPSRQTLYDWGFDKLDSLKRAISNNKRKVKQNLRKQWAKDDASPTLQLALYKLICTEEERRALAMEYRDHTSKGDKLFTELKSIIPPPDESN